MKDLTTATTTIVTAPGQLTRPTYAVPALDRHQVLVAVTECGLCAGEVDLWAGRAPDALPAPIGHEIAGDVLDVGAAVTAVRIGDRVVGWIEGGGFADRLVMEERYAVAVSRDLPYPSVAEPLSCCVNAVELAAPQLADDVLIVGAGLMSLLIARLSVLKGARSVTVAARRPEALERARAHGATHVVDLSAAGALHDARRLVTDARGWDVVYEGTGVEDGLALAAGAARMSGKLVIVGYHQGGTRAVDLGRINYQGLTLVNAHFRDRDQIMRGLRAGMRLVEAGLLDPAGLVSHTFGLDRLADALDLAAARPADYVKAVITT